MGKLTGAIPGLIIANIIFFAITYGLPDMQEPMFRALALYFPQHPNFEAWQPISNMFMHGGFTHILFNMYALWAFGTPLALMWGKHKFLAFYFLSGIGASIIYTLVNYFQFNMAYDEVLAHGISPAQIQDLFELSRQEMASFINSTGYARSAFAEVSRERLVDLYTLYSVPAVGASGAIYGVLVAFGVLFPNAKLMLIFFPFPIAAKYFIPVLIAIDLFSGVTGFSIFGSGIAHFGHVGGALIGFLLMLYFRKHVRTPPKVDRNDDQIGRGLQSDG